MVMTPPTLTSLQKAHTWKSDDRSGCFSCVSCHDTCFHRRISLAIIPRTPAAVFSSLPPHSSTPFPPTFPHTLPTRFLPPIYLQWVPCSATSHPPPPLPPKPTYPPLVRLPTRFQTASWCPSGPLFPPKLSTKQPPSSRN